MRSSSKRLMTGAVASLALAAAASAGPAAPATASTAGISASRLPHAAARAGSQLWVSLYDGSIGSSSATAVAIGHSGKDVFVTGTSYGGDTAYDYATVAYNAATGAQLWVARYNDPSNSQDYAYAITVSPDGKAVFVTGTSYQSSSAGYDFATVAYNAATGAQLWVRRSPGPGPYNDPAAIAVSPNGRTVFVTGTSRGKHYYEYATIAYRAATGAQLWIKHYDGPDLGDSGAAAATVSPNGKAVFVTGASYGGSQTTGYDYATIAYRVTTGAQLWVKRYNGPASDTDEATAMAISPSGKLLFVTGYSTGKNLSYDYATVAYDAVAGRQIWVKRYNGPGNYANEATAVAVSPSGKAVFVTGYSTQTDSNYDYATIGYNSRTGKQLWLKRYNGSGNGADYAYSIAVSPNSRTVYVTGSTTATSNERYGTIAYNAATGARLWLQIYDNSSIGPDSAAAIAVNPVSGTVFVTGSSYGEYGTIAYQG